MTDWDQIHRAVVDAFRRGWDQPHPHAWDGFFADQVTFVQPMLRDGEGAELWWQESARTLMLLPDLRADVLSWSGNADLLYIHIRFTATLARRPLTWTAVDLLRLTAEGKLLHRESFFDSAPVAAAVSPRPLPKPISRPRSWRRWWRSGVGPFEARRMTNERDVDGIRDVFTTDGRWTATIDGLLIRADGIEQIHRGWSTMCRFMAARRMFVSKTLVTADEHTVVNEWVGTVSGRSSARGIEVWQLDPEGKVVDQRLYGFLDARPDTSPIQNLRMLLAHPLTAAAFGAARVRSTPLG